MGIYLGFGLFGLLLLRLVMLFTDFASGQAVDCHWRCDFVYVVSAFDLIVSQH